MQEGQLLMDQRDRDRLGILKEVERRHLKQAAAAATLQVSVRQLQRLLKAFKNCGDGVVVHALRGRPSNRKMAEKLEKRAVEILSREEYRGFGPTLVFGQTPPDRSESGNGAEVDAPGRDCGGDASAR